MSQAYWDRVSASISEFWSRGQELRCMRIYRQENGTCQMCGHKPIKWQYVLHNQQTGGVLIVGRECIKNYKVVTGEQVVFPERFKKAAEFLNGRYPACVVVAPVHVAPENKHEPDEDEREFELYDALGLDPHEPDFDEFAAEGLDPDEYDWDAHDYDPD